MPVKLLDSTVYSTMLTKVGWIAGLLGLIGALAAIWVTTHLR